MAPGMALPAHGTTVQGSRFKVQGSKCAVEPGTLNLELHHQEEKRMLCSRRIMAAILGSIAAACALCSPALADWPQFLGPDSTAMARQSPRLPRQWPEGGPKVLW